MTPWPPFKVLTSAATCRRGPRFNPAWPWGMGTNLWYSRAAFRLSLPVGGLSKTALRQLWFTAI